jgi:hypothetical protein
MIDVVCFCGCSYSFADDVGACPECGERVTFTRASGDEVQDMRDQLGQLLTQSADDSPPEEIAA